MLRSGLNTSRDVEINSFKDRRSKPYKVTRRLVNTSVHKLGDFGAVQLGEHDFYVDDEKVENAPLETPPYPVFATYRNAHNYVKAFTFV